MFVISLRAVCDDCFRSEFVIDSYSFVWISVMIYFIFDPIPLNSILIRKIQKGIILTQVFDRAHWQFHHTYCLVFCGLSICLRRPGHRSKVYRDWLMPN